MPIVASFSLVITQIFPVTFPCLLCPLSHTVFPALPPPLACLHPASNRRLCLRSPTLASLRDSLSFPHRPGSICNRTPRSRVHSLALLPPLLPLYASYHSVEVPLSASSLPSSTPDNQVEVP